MLGRWGACLLFQSNMCACSSDSFAPCAPAPLCQSASRSVHASAERRLDVLALIVGAWLR